MSDLLILGIVSHMMAGALMLPKIPAFRIIGLIVVVMFWAEALF